MNLKQMGYFSTIVKEGSISAAAKTLHISQPPLSAQMKLLEEELGVTLFERGSRSIRMTDAGKLFFERCQGILHLTEAAREELTQMGKGLKGTLRLGMISSAQTESLIGLLSTFCSRHPEVAFRIFEGNTYELLEQLEGGIIEAALVRTPFPGETYDRLPLITEPMMAAGFSRFFPADSGSALFLRELSGCPLIIYRRWEEVLRRSFGTAPNYLCINDDARTSLTWARCGTGIAVVPASIIDKNIPGLTVKTIKDPGLESCITLIRRKKRSSSPIVQALFSFLGTVRTAGAASGEKAVDFRTEKQDADTDIKP